MNRFSSVLSAGGIGELLIVAAILSSGCSSSGTSVAPVSETIQKQLLVEQQPVDISSLKSTYASFQADQQVAGAKTTDQQVVPEEELSEQAKSAQVVTVAGRIYAQGMSPFDPKESVFTIMELPKPGHNHEDPGDCPFCLREIQNAKIAIVRVVDSSGKTFPQPADKLLGLIKNQDIVVQGKASQVGDTLVIDLQSMHILGEDAAHQLSETFHHS
jgi:hypothetical protein